MRVTFRLTADIEPEQADPLRDKLTARLAEEGCQPSADWSTNERPFTVVGIYDKGDPTKRWWHRLMALDAADAERKAQAHDKRRLPIVVLEGHVDAGEGA